MDRNTLLKTKPLPAEDSEEEETDSSDEEETEDEEQAEELSAYESDSDESTDATKKRQQGAANGKQQVLISSHPFAVDEDLLLRCVWRHVDKVLGYLLIVAFYVLIFPHVLLPDYLPQGYVFSCL